MSLMDFLVWISVSGGNTMIASWLLERSNWFQSKAADVKKYIFFGLSALLAVSSYLITRYVPVDFLTVLTPIFSILYVTWGSVFLGEVFHKFDKV